MPITHDVDLVILGSGFGGSLLTQIACRLDLRVALVDQARHPRFAIGESSTPAADLILAALSRRYQLAAMMPLTSYGTWKAKLPQLSCGRKRGFSYFAHQAGQPLEFGPEHTNEMLVAASRDNHNCDTHWYRSDVDHYFVQQARDAGAEIWEGTRILCIEDREPWRFQLKSESGSWQVRSPLVVDATGGGGALLRLLRVADATNLLRTRSAAVYSHFNDVHRWAQLLEQSGAATIDYPFDPDDSALHHVMQDGWMWNLRFDNGLVSAGMCILEGSAAHHALEHSSPAEWLQARIARYPGIAWMFGDAKLACKPGQVLSSGRLQRRAAQAAERDWIALPHTVGFVDPLHSTGIAHTLAGVERVARMLDKHWQRATWADEVRAYEATVFTELDFVDQVVHGCYRAMSDFERFKDYSMTYFAAATCWEKRRMEAPDEFEGALFCADDLALRRAVNCLYVDLLQSHSSGQPAEIAASRERTRQALAPFNHAGLCDPAVKNMYRYTAMAKPE